MMKPILLEAKEITKRFPGVLALQQGTVGYVHETATAKQ
jgi:hypothetical protein